MNFGVLSALALIAASGDSLGMSLRTSGRNKKLFWLTYGILEGSFGLVLLYHLGVL